jgi:glycosyltransferase involved in cell wall biosynthesis
LLSQDHAQTELPLLVLAGKRGWLESETLRAAETSVARKNIRFIGYVPDADLPALYSGATCFAYPSIFEGFGLPVVEAMQCGTPVIAGDRTSLPEIVGDAGVLVDPFDETKIAEALMRMIRDPSGRAELRERSFQRARRFTWTKTARLTLEAYERASVMRRSSKD